MNASSCMKKNVVSVPVTATIREAARRDESTGTGNEGFLF